MIQGAFKDSSGAFKHSADEEDESTIVNCFICGQNIEIIPWAAVAAHGLRNAEGANLVAARCAPRALPLDEILRVC